MLGFYGISAKTRLWWRILLHKNEVTYKNYNIDLAIFSGDFYWNLLGALSDNSIWSKVSVMTIEHIRAVTPQCIHFGKLPLNSAEKIFNESSRCI